MSFNLFAKKLSLLLSKNPQLIINTLSNIFTMRLIGNKTHGDLAEIGIAEFINQFMYDYRSDHVGKDKYRAKEHEEDIQIYNELDDNDNFPISLKAYGVGPLQLSTDSESTMFSFLSAINDRDIINPTCIKKITTSKCFSHFNQINVLPLIYNEKENECNIMLFDYKRALSETARVCFIDKNQRFNYENGIIETGEGREHPIFLFLNITNQYICEVRYGGKSANALQRGLWTHTKNAVYYFNSLTGGWIQYEHNLILVRLFRLALNATKNGHEKANKILQDDILEFKANASITK